MSEAFGPLIIGGIFNTFMNTDVLTLDHFFVNIWYLFNTWTRMGLGIQPGAPKGFCTLFNSISIPIFGETMLNYIANRPDEWVSEWVMPFLTGLPPTQKLFYNGVV